MRSTGIRWFCALVWAAGAAVAGAAETVDKAVVDKLRAALEQPGTGLSIDSVETSEIPGLYAVQFKGGPLVYATADGAYFLSGDLFAAGPDGFVNLGEKRRDAERRELLAAVPVKDMIVFAPEGERKAYITVFTDVTCFYCQKLHLEVPELNKNGVEVRYLAYPRAGKDSDGYRKLVTAWCADNRQEALTSLKAKQPVPESLCKDNPVMEEYELGLQLGVRGTPAIITEQGEMIPGYKPAADLIAVLGVK